MPWTSVKALRGARVTARDAGAGALVDVHIEGHDWRACNLVLQIGGASSGRRVLVPPNCLAPGGLARERIVLALTREQIYSSPDLAAGRAADVLSAVELLGCQVVGADRRCGRIVDVLLSEDDWIVPGVVVRLGRWRMGPRVLVPGPALERVDVMAQAVHVSLAQSRLACFPRL